MSTRKGWWRRMDQQRKKYREPKDTLWGKCLTTFIAIVFAMSTLTIIPLAGALDSPANEQADAAAAAAAKEAANEAEGKTGALTPQSEVPANQPIETATTFSLQTRAVAAERTPNVRVVYSDGKTNPSAGYAKGKTFTFDALSGTTVGQPSMYTSLANGLTFKYYSCRDGGGMGTSSVSQPGDWWNPSGTIYMDIYVAESSTGTSTGGGTGTGGGNQGESPYITVVHKYYTNGSYDGTQTTYPAATPSSSSTPKSHYATDYWVKTYNGNTYSTDSYNPYIVRVSKGATGNQGTITLTYKRTVTTTYSANVTYSKNTSDVVTNMPSPNPQALNWTANDEELAGNYNFNVSTNIPQRDGYEFMGWAYDPSTSPDAGWLIKPGKQTNAVRGGTSTLYAIWKATDPSTQTGDFTVEKHFSGLLTGVEGPQVSLTYKAWRTKDGNQVGNVETGKVTLAKNNNGTYSGKISPTVWDFTGYDNDDPERARYKNVIQIIEDTDTAKVDGHTWKSFKSFYPADAISIANTVTFTMDGATFRKTLSVKNTYEINMVTVTWLKEDGTQIKQETIPEGTDYRDLYPTDLSTTGEWSNPKLDENGNITIRWQEAKITATWMDGYTNTPIKTETVAKDITDEDLHGLYPDDPTRDGYIFNGWDSKRDSSGNITITAKWIAGHPIKYTLRYHSGTTDEVENMPAEQSADVTSLTYTTQISSQIPTREGYTFSHWTIGPAGARYDSGAEFVFTATSWDTSSVSYEMYAHWTEDIPDAPTTTEIKAMDGRLHIVCEDNSEHNLTWDLGYGGEWCDRSAKVTKGEDGNYHWYLTVNVDNWAALDSDWLKEHRDSVDYDHMKSGKTTEPLVVNFTYSAGKWSMDNEPYIYLHGPQVTYRWLDALGNEIKNVTQSKCLNAVPEFDGSLPTKPAADGKVYEFDKWSDPEANEDGTIITFTPEFTEDEDVLGNDPDNIGDGIADKYQAVVTFAGVGGTVGGRTQLDYVVTLKDAAGNNAVDGTYTLTETDVPATAAAEGYAGTPAWSAQNPVGVTVGPEGAAFVASWGNGFVAYYYDGMLGTAVDANVGVGGTIDVEAAPSTTFGGRSYVLDRVDNNNATVVAGDPGQNVVSVYYDLDEVGNDPANPGNVEHPDGVADKYQVTINYTSADDAQGTVAGTTSKVITLADVDGSYVETAIVTPGAEGITLTPAASHEFDAWDSDPNVELAVQGGNTYTYTAGWKLRSFDIDVQVANGTSDAATVGTTVNYGGDVTYTFTPNEGYVLAGVTVDGNPAALSADGTFTFNAVTRGHTIVVAYALAPIDEPDEPTVPVVPTEPTNPTDPTNPTTPTTPGGGTTTPTVPVTPGEGVVPAVATPAAAAAAAAAVEAIADDGNPLAAITTPEAIDDDANALAAFEEIHCWTHWLMLFGALVTIVYGLGVLYARRHSARDMDDFEDDIMDGSRRYSARQASDPAANGAFQAM